jgi:hypothetical protein
MLGISDGSGEVVGGRITYNDLMKHIFISHSAKDASDVANQLVAALESSGRTCWVAPRNVKAGVSYPGQIVDAICGCAGLVVLVTPGANESRDVQQEVQIAHDERKLIVPLIVDGTQPTADLRYFLSVRHRVAWTEGKAVVAALAKEFPTDKEKVVALIRSDKSGSVTMQDVMTGCDLDQLTANSILVDMSNDGVLQLMPANDYNVVTRWRLR